MKKTAKEQIKMATIINGKEVSAKVKEQVAEEVKQLKEKGVHPGLAVVIVGEDPASKTYVKNKKLACQAVGIHSEEYALPAETTQEELVDLVHKLNEKQDIDGILVQSPLPKGLDEQLVIENINPAKDVDAFHPVNVGRIMIGDYSFLPCTPAGVIELIHSTGVSIKGKRCVVIGRSNIAVSYTHLDVYKRQETTVVNEQKSKLSKGKKWALRIIAAVAFGLVIWGVVALTDFAMGFVKGWFS